MGFISDVIKSQLFIVVVFQIVLIVLFGFFSEYDDGANASIDNGKPKIMDAGYPMFQDIHAVFVGFGFVMTFLKRYGYSALGFNLLLAALVTQWAIFCRGVFASHGNVFKIGLKSLMGADIAAATSALISIGAVFGQTSCLQLLIMVTIEIVIYSVNEYLFIDLLQIADAGGAVIVHTFGGYFGLAVSFVLRPRKVDFKSHGLKGVSYTSDIFSIMGTIFLWIFWPSFNGGLVSDDVQYRVIVNTYLSLAASIVTAFVISSITSPEDKFDMLHIQNSTLAGGVAIGSICNMMIHPFGAMLTGTVAGTISVCCHRYLTPMVTRKFKLTDTCSVHNIHGVPGIFSGLLSGLITLMATEQSYKSSLYSVFPAMKPITNSTIGNEHGLQHLEPRSLNEQAGYQILGLLITLMLALITGLFTGILLKMESAGQLSEVNKYDDEFQWEVPDPQHEDSNDE